MTVGQTCFVVAVLSSLGLVSGNFVYQLFDGHHWALAAERSWFCIIADAWGVFSCWWVLRRTISEGANG